jgi:hypothetical protein
MNLKTFCVNPWVSLHVKMLEGFNPCCLFKKEMNYTSVNEYVNSVELASVKQQLLNGEAIPECSTCWQQENVGYTSKRQRDNKTYNKIFQLLNKDLAKSHGKFVEYYLRLGNHCNLRCTSCNDRFSSGWISENKKFNIATRTVSELPDDHDVWQHIEANANTVGSIEFIGGEPFMISIDKQVSLLKYLVDTGHARHIRIKYNTNGTRFPTEQLEFWPAFKAIEINVSADGIGDRFEYLRFPAKWTEVDSTIGHYQQLQKTMPQLELTMITTLSVMNIGYIQETLDYCQQRNLALFINLLEGPATLNLFKIDSKARSWIKERIQGIDNPVIKNILDNIDLQPSTVTGKMLLDFLTPLDHRRNLNVRQTFPELAQCLE